MELVNLTIAMFSSHAFKRNVGQARKAALDGPVFITDRAGRPTQVLLSIEEHQRITGGHQKVADLLAKPGIAEIELVAPLARELARAAELT